MTNSFSESVYLYAVALASVSRIFTLEQIGTHAYLRDLSQPRKKAWKYLSPYREHFKCSPGRRGTQFKWRLSLVGKRHHHLRFRDIDPQSAKAEHWIEIGNVFLALQRYGGRPTVFEAEPRNCANMDIAAVWRKKAYFIEVQRSPLTDRDWIVKWKKIRDWYVVKGYEKLPWWEGHMAPNIVLINRTGRQVAVPKGIQVYSVADLMAIENAR